MENINDRQKQLLSLIKENQIIEFDTIKKLTGNTDLTLYKDLALLEKLKMIYRTKEGIILRNIETEKNQTDLSQVEKEFLEEKKRIGRFASTMISNGESLLIDGGSTTFVFASYLLNKNNLLVITNALRVGNILSKEKKSKNQILLIGGYASRNTYSTYGSPAIEVLKKVKTNRVVMGVCGIDPALGIFASNEREAETKRIMLDCAKEVMILADHSKFGTTTDFLISDLSRVKVVITDERITSSEAKAMKEKNILLHIV
jgi:DeoR family transcriptional regulator of aga operon/DeoR family fructose operon transcriptional repressor